MIGVLTITVDYGGRRFVIHDPEVSSLEATQERRVDWEFGNPAPITVDYGTYTVTIVMKARDVTVDEGNQIDGCDLIVVEDHGNL